MGRAMRQVLIACMIGIVIFVPISAAQETATAQVKATVDRVLEVLKDPVLKRPAKEAERRRRLREAIYPRFDFSEMAKRSLGIHWRERTPQEREEFERLFADLLERSYYQKLDSYTDEEVLYTNEEVDGSIGVVKTKIVSNKEKIDIPIDYKLAHRDGQWKVYDVTIEGVSLVNNYRSQFNRIIQTSSYAELVRKMRAKRGGEGFSPVPGRHK